MAKARKQALVEVLVGVVLPKNCARCKGRILPRREGRIPDPRKGAGLPPYTTRRWLWKRGRFSGGSVNRRRQIFIPPETSIRWALTQRFSSESSDAIIGPISSATPARPSAVISATQRLTSGLSRTTPPLKSVSTAPGATTLAVMCRGPSSRAM